VGNPFSLDQPKASSSAVREWQSIILVPRSPGDRRLHPVICRGEGKSGVLRWQQPSRCSIADQALQHKEIGRRRRMLAIRAGPKEPLQLPPLRHQARTSVGRLSERRKRSRRPGGRSRGRARKTLAASDLRVGHVLPVLAVYSFAARLVVLFERKTDS